MLAIVSIDLGGSHISVAAVQDGRVLADAHMPTAALSLGAELDAIAMMGHACLRRSGRNAADLRGVALGFCGVVDGERSEILSTLDKYPDAPELNLSAWAQREFGVPLRMENDACLALLGEASAGAAQGVQDVVMITLGTGIGGAAMIGGRLLRSHAGQAGCLGGHLPVNYRGRRCSCGGIGCAEAEASTAVLPVLVREHPGFAESLLQSQPLLDFKQVFAAMDAGDTVANDVVRHCVEVWSALTVALVHAYGPALVIFGGGVMQRSEALLGPICEYVAAHTWRTSRGLPSIVRAQLGHQAALLGGATLFSGSLDGEQTERRDTSADV